MNAVREEYIIGERASAEVIGLELGLGESRIDHVVSVINDAPGGRGYARLYAVAADKSFVSQRAVGRITKRGVKSESSVEGVVYIAGEAPSPIRSR
ncbi:SufD family Fe-S cluster assembly protein [Pyrobaculum aerophilum]|uniref:SufD family Fe-S cluster assembly protein n=1 Tax=Pyrobaculum aerophilum TaxID=13773 RepID=UPI002161BD2C|nr:SufD family Fe-S cluster assembly protein [Pyrobaculum aerophilum]